MHVCETLNSICFIKNTEVTSIKQSMEKTEKKSFKKHLKLMGRT